MSRIKMSGRRLTARTGAFRGFPPFIKVYVTVSANRIRYLVGAPVSTWQWAAYFFFLTTSYGAS